MSATKMTVSQFKDRMNGVLATEYLEGRVTRFREDIAKSGIAHAIEWYGHEATLAEKTIQKIATLRRIVADTTKDYKEIKEQLTATRTAMEKRLTDASMYEWDRCTNGMSNQVQKCESMAQAAAYHVTLNALCLMEMYEKQ